MRTETTAPEIVIGPCWYCGTESTAVRQPGERLEWEHVGPPPAWSGTHEVNVTPARSRLLGPARPMTTLGQEGQQKYERELARRGLLAVAEHKTRTYLMATARHSEATPLNWRTGRLRQPGDSVAECSCDWKTYTETREQARAQARAHRAGRL